MIRRPGGHDAHDEYVLVPLHVEHERIYLAAHELSNDGEEHEIAAKLPTIDEVLNGITALARGAAVRLQDTDASKVSVEFGCEFAVESGSLVAIIGKASGKSAFKVGLEWSSSASQP